MSEWGRARSDLKAWRATHVTRDMFAFVINNLFKIITSVLEIQGKLEPDYYFRELQDIWGWNFWTAVPVTTSKFNFKHIVSINYVELQWDNPNLSCSLSISSICSQLIKLKNREAPVLRILPEALPAIFHVGRTISRSDDPNLKVPFQVLVSQVIRRSWRETALLYPSLADTIVVLPGQIPDALQAFPLSFRDLRQVLAYSGDEWPRYFSRNLEVLATQAYRWREFYVEASDQHLVHRNIGRLDRCGLVFLKKSIST